MKQKFSNKWKASKQPRKKRKYFVNAPKHIKHRFMSATLSKELRAKHKIRNIEVRKGDEVEVMRGKFDGRKGKVTIVDMRRMKIAVEGLQATKRDGTKVNVWFHPSKVKIIILNTEDKKRINVKAPESVSSDEQIKTVSSDGQKTKQGDNKNAPKKK